jgi:hypothetical protein
LFAKLPGRALQKAGSLHYFTARPFLFFGTVRVLGHIGDLSLDYGSITVFLIQRGFGQFVSWCVGDFYFLIVLTSSQALFCLRPTTQGGLGLSTGLVLILFRSM